ncbi:MAG: hypothetical protein KatS3mg112_1527 [Thermogutta sp.]|nr:MAG: hypothetical protein KatS3mg112_1527 [Thermogutta sp.]
MKFHGRGACWNFGRCKGDALRKIFEGERDWASVPVAANRYIHVTTFPGLQGHDTEAVNRKEVIADHQFDRAGCRPRPSREDHRDGEIAFFRLRFSSEVHGGLSVALSHVDRFGDHAFRELFQTQSKRTCVAFPIQINLERNCPSGFQIQLAWHFPIWERCFGDMDGDVLGDLIIPQRGTHFNHRGELVFPQ